MYNTALLLIYKQGLKSYSGKMSHERAHRKALQNVTPVIARSYFKKSKVPRAEHYLSKDTVEKMEKNAVLTACAMSTANLLSTSIVAFHTIRHNQNK